MNRVDDMMRHYRMTAMVKLLAFHKATFKENWAAYRYLQQHKERIE